jgi:putative transcriptional regulator
MRKQNKHREKMKQLRLERGWTQEDVGNMLGITGSAYGMIELGVRTPRLPLAVKMQELFGVPVAELFFEDQPNATCGEGESA